MEKYICMPGEADGISYLTDCAVVCFNEGNLQLKCVKIHDITCIKIAFIYI